MQTQNQYFAETADLFIPLSEDEQARVQGGGCDPDAAANGVEQGIRAGALRGAVAGIPGGLGGILAGALIGGAIGGAVGRAVGCGVDEVARRLPRPRRRYFA